MKEQVTPLSQDSVAQSEVLAVRVGDVGHAVFDDSKQTVGFGKLDVVVDAPSKKGLREVFLRVAGDHHHGSHPFFGPKLGVAADFGDIEDQVFDLV